MGVANLRLLAPGVGRFFGTRSFLPDLGIIEINRLAIFIHAGDAPTALHSSQLRFGQCAVRFLLRRRFRRFLLRGFPLRSFRPAPIEFRILLRSALWRSRR